MLVSRSNLPFLNSIIVITWGLGCLFFSPTDLKDVDVIWQKVTQPERRAKLKCNRAGEAVTSWLMVSPLMLQSVKDGNQRWKRDGFTASSQKTFIYQPYSIKYCSVPNSILLRCTKITTHLIPETPQKRACSSVKETFPTLLLIEYILLMPTPRLEPKIKCNSHGV